MPEHMQRSPGAHDQPSRDIVQEAPRRGGKWIWSRISGLRQQLSKGLGPKEELEEKIGKLESIITLRAIASGRIKFLRGRIGELERKLSELQCELDGLRAGLSAEEAEVSVWRSISLYGQDFGGGRLLMAGSTRKIRLRTTGKGRMRGRSRHSSTGKKRMRCWRLSTRKSGQEWS